MENKKLQTHGYPLNFTDFSIETRRCRLRIIHITDAQEIFNEFTPEIAVWMYPKPAKSLEETLQFINAAGESLQEGHDLTLCAEDKVDGSFLGCTGLHHLKDETPALGIWLKLSAQGRGLGLEIINALVIWAGKNLAAKSLIYPVDRRNHASVHIALKLGGVLHSEYQVINQADRQLEIAEYRIDCRK